MQNNEVLQAEILPNWSFHFLLTRHKCWGEFFMMLNDVCDVDREAKTWTLMDWVLTMMLHLSSCLNELKWNHYYYSLLYFQQCLNIFLYVQGLLHFFLHTSITFTFLSKWWYVSSCVWRLASLGGQTSQFLKENVDASTCSTVKWREKTAVIFLTKFKIER